MYLRFPPKAKQQADTWMAQRGGDTQKWIEDNYVLRDGYWVPREYMLPVLEAEHKAELQYQARRKFWGWLLGGLISWALLIALINIIL